MTPSPKKVCKRCGRNMILRTGSRGKFWGCGGYPSCKYTENYQADGELRIAFFAFNKSIVNELKAKVARGLNFTGFKPSAYQQSIADFVLKGKGNAFVGAVAGSGKSTTALWQLSLLGGTPNISTLHSHGFQCLLKNFPQEPIVDEFKKDGIAKELLPDDEDNGIDNKYARSILVNLTSLVQNTLTDEDDVSAIYELIEHFGVETNGCEEQVLELLPEMVKRCADRVSVIDFDDMIWMPVRLNLPITQYDWVFIDESQDLNMCQIEMLRRTLAKNGRIIGVGDENQSIYGFRGADAEAVSKFIEIFDAITLPLSITYRCPASHVRLLQMIVPTIEAAPNAPEGELIYDMPLYKATAEMKSGDMVLCRVNAPLVKVCYSLIRSGKKAVIRGRDIGKGLISLVDKMRAASIVELVQKLEDYRRRELDKLFAKGARESSIMALNDRIDTLEALTDNCRDLTELRARIETIFSDKEEGTVCSSIHKAKGLEADNVYIIEPQLMPFPKATKAWEIDQEWHCAYVGGSRARRKMVWVDGKPSWLDKGVEQQVRELLGEEEGVTE